MIWMKKLAIICTITISLYTSSVLRDLSFSWTGADLLITWQQLRACHCVWSGSFCFPMRSSTLIACDSKTPQPINTKFCTRDYFAQITECARNIPTQLAKHHGFPYRGEIGLYIFLVSQARDKRWRAQSRMMAQMTRNHPRMCLSGASVGR